MTPPEGNDLLQNWVRFFKSFFARLCVIPAKAGIQASVVRFGIPAFARITEHIPAQTVATNWVRFYKFPDGGDGAVAPQSR
jgi:hypothetical protein